RHHLAPLRTSAALARVARVAVHVVYAHHAQRPVSRVTAIAAVASPCHYRTPPRDRELQTPPDPHASIHTGECRRGEKDGTDTHRPTPLRAAFGA
ncbi:hypothetical protein CA226_16365, partial [Sphingomonas koreensis]